MNKEVFDEDKPSYRNVEIFTLDSEDDVIEFLMAIQETTGLTESNRVRICQIFEMIQYPFTVVFEREYVDKLYRDTYYAYFASKHTRFAKNCKRLAFFQGYIDPEKFYVFDENTEDILKKSFVGICILKPIKVGKIGRTLLDPTKLKIGSSYVRTTRFEFIIMGHNLSIDAFPYSSQDSETMTCAETTVWSILEYFGTRYSEYRTVLPSQLISELERISQERILPSRGLDYYKVSELLKIFGFSPRLYARSAFEKKKNQSEDFKKIFHYYVESGIPLAVGVSGKSDGADVKHSVVCIGHGGNRKAIKEVASIAVGEYKYIDSADLYDDYVIMDDNQQPYKVEPFNALTKYDNSRIVVFAVPLYKRAFLEANDASVLITEIFKHRDIGFSKIVPNIDEKVDDDNPLVLRIFLTSSRKYRSFRAKHEKERAAKYFYGTFQFPKFIWVAEISTYASYKQNKVYGEIVIDATSSRMSHIDSLIMIRYLDHVGYRLPNEGTRQVMDRLKHRATSFTFPYVMYENNLKKSGGFRNDEKV